MQFKTFSLKNYKPFADIGPLQFSPGLNVIVGTNNSGKTALRDGLSLRFDAHPHRSIASMPRADSVIPLASAAAYSISVTGEEVRRVWDSLPQIMLSIPLEGFQANTSDGDRLLDVVSRMPEILVNLSRLNKSGSTTFEAGNPLSTAYSPNGNPNARIMYTFRRTDQASPHSCFGLSG